MTTTRRRLLLALLVAYPAALIIVATAQGIGVSIDSVSYIATARSFAAGDGLLSYDGLPLTIFPPGYPLLLGTLLALGLSVNVAAVAINVVCVVLVVVATYALASRALGGDSAPLFVTAFVSLSSALVMTFSFAWSESAFTLLVLCALIVIVDGIRRQSLRWPGIALLAVVVSLATTVRYAGVTLVPIVVLGVFLANRPAAGRRHSVVRAAMAGALSLTGFVLVAVRNVSLGSGIMGDRYGGSRTIEGGFTTAMRAIGDLVAPSETTSLSAFAGVIVAVLVFAGLWVAFLRRNHTVLVLAVFVTVYWATIVVSQATARLDEASERFAVPALVPLVVVAAYALRELSLSAARQLQAAGFASASSAKRLLAAVGLVALILTVGLSMVHGLRFANNGADKGLVQLAVEPSALLDATVAAPGGIASNDPWSVWWARQRGPVVDLPVSPTEWPQVRVDDDVARLVDAVADGRVDHIAVFADGRSYLSLDELRDFGLVLTELEQFDDGGLYAVGATVG